MFKYMACCEAGGGSSMQVPVHKPWLCLITLPIFMSVLAEDIGLPRQLSEEVIDEKVKIV